MARNWKVGEAVEAIKSGNKADIMDLGRRFPLFANLAAQTNEAGVALMHSIPEHISARQLEARLKGDVEVTEDGEEAPEEKAAPAAKADKAAPAPKAEKDPYAGKTAKDLYGICKERNIKVEPKQDVEVYAKALKKDDAAKAKAKPAAKEEDGDDWGEEEAPKTKGKAKPAAKDEEEDWGV